MPPARPLAAPYSNHRALPPEVGPGISLGPQSTAQVWLLSPRMGHHRVGIRVGVEGRSLYEKEKVLSKPHHGYVRNHYLGHWASAGPSTYPSQREQNRRSSG